MLLDSGPGVISSKKTGEDIAAFAARSTLIPVISKCAQEPPSLDRRSLGKILYPVIWHVHPFLA
jgi:hypothetical protein